MKSREAFTETLVALSSGMVEITKKSLPDEKPLPLCCISLDESLLKENELRMTSNNPVNNFNGQFDNATFPA